MYDDFWSEFISGYFRRFRSESVWPDVTLESVWPVWRWNEEMRIFPKVALKVAKGVFILKVTF